MPTALQLFDEWKLDSRSFKLYFGSNIIDETIGGISCQGITEVSGEAGSGKSQMCMMLSLRCQLKSELGGLSGSTAYMSCGEGEFPIRRLQQLAESYESWTGISSTSFLSRIHIEKCYCSENIQETLLKRIPTMCRTENIRLLIIDSLAGVVRTEFDHTKFQDIMQRTEILFKIATQLKWLADTYKIAIIVVNQVTGGGQNLPASSFGINENIPALGLVWSHCINTRICLYRDSTLLRRLNIATGDSDDDKDVRILTENTVRAVSAVAVNNTSIKSQSHRLMVLELSAVHPRSACTYKITDEGTVGVSIVPIGDTI